MRRAPLLAFVLVAACGPARTPPAAPPPAAAAPAPAAPAKDGAVKEGDGWKRTGPGQWTFALDGDRVPDMGLTAVDEGAGILRLTLPAGAKQARVARLRVAYVEPGKALWQVFREEKGTMGEQPAASLPIAVTAPDLTGKGKAPQWLDHALVGAPLVVTGAFFAVFSSADQPRPAVAGLRGQAQGSRFFYRQWPRSRPQPVAHQAYVRVVLEDVE